MVDLLGVWADEGILLILQNNVSLDASRCQFFFLPSSIARRRRTFAYSAICFTIPCITCNAGPGLMSYGCRLQEVE